MDERPGRREIEATPSAEELVLAAKVRVRDFVELAAAEARLAALSGLAMLMLVMVAAAALIVAWGLIIACMLYLFERADVGWVIPALVIAVAHAGFAYYLWELTVRLSRNLTLPELRTTLVRVPDVREAQVEGRG